MKNTISQNRTMLMGLAMIAIIMFHCSFTIIPGITAVFSRFGLWGVDVFMFLSGFGCAYALNKTSPVEFLKRRAERLLPACLVIGLMVCIADLYFHAERVNTCLAIRILSLHRWYIQAIIICYLLCPFFYNIIKHYKAIGLILLVFVAFICGKLCPDLDPFRLNWAIWRMPAFMIGLYIGLYDYNISWRGYLIAFVVLIAAVIARLRGGGIIRRRLDISACCCHAGLVFHGMSSADVVR